MRPCAERATALSIVQDAADLVAAASRIVVVNGLYATGGRAVGTNVLVNRLAGANQFLERSTNLLASPPFTLLAPYLYGQPGTTSFTDNNAIGGGPCLYRVGVGPSGNRRTCSQVPSMPRRQES